MVPVRSITALQLRSNLGLRTFKLLAFKLFVSLMLGVLVTLPGVAQAQYATGGSGNYKSEIIWFSWGAHGDNVGNSTRQNTYTFAEQTLVVTCSIRNLSGTIQAYRPGDWSGDGLDDLYNISGTGRSNQLVIGLNTLDAGQPSFTFDCSATLDGTAFPLDGLVMADAEQSTTNEWVQATIPSTRTDGTPSVWRIIDRYRTAGCTFSSTALQTDTSTTRTLRLSGNSAALCGSGPMAVAFMDGVSTANVTMKGGGKSAIALGVIIEGYDRVDAPASYGAAPHANFSSFAGGTLTPGTNTSVNNSSFALATRSVAPLRLGSLIDVEAALLFSAAADGDDTNNTDDEDALAAGQPGTIGVTAGGTYTLSGITCTGSGVVRGWIDWNRDGDFGDTGETSANAPTCTSSTASLNWTVPAGVQGGASFLRLRTASDSTQIALATGSASTGEAEDYPLTLASVTDLSITKAQRQGTSGTFQTTPLTVARGQTIQYRLVVTNGGPSAVTGATFSDPVPSNISSLSVVSATGGGSATACSASFTGSTLNGTFGGPSGATCTVILQGTTVSSGSGTFSNTATVTPPSSSTDSVSGNNSATVSTTVPPLASAPCSTTYAGGLDTPFGIYPLNDSGAAGTALFNAPYATAAFARDPVTDRLYFIENTPTGTTARIGYYNFATGEVVAAGTITKAGGDTGNFTRFAFNAQGVGYASIGINSGATTRTDSVYTIRPSGINAVTATRIGQITGLPTTGALSGDFAITAANRAWLSANGEIYRINLNDASLPAVAVVNTNNADANGVAFTTSGNLLVSDGTTSREVNLATFKFGAARTMTGPNTSGDLANCLTPTLDASLNVVKSVSPTGAVAPGTVLTYTITTTNTGNAVAVNTTLQDAIPANTTYVANSTTLNGAAVADVGGVMPFVTASAINSPATTLPGDSTATTYGSGIVSTSAPAVVTFQVRVNNPFPATVTSVTNQGFASYDSGSSDTRITVDSAPPGGTGGTQTTVGGRDFGDAPDTAAGTSSGNYQTTAGDGGPSHTITSNLKLGLAAAAATDADSGTLQNAAALADDADTTDDENALASFPLIGAASGQTLTVTVNVTNTTGAAAALVGYLDFNKDGDFLDTGEQSGTVSVANNATTANVSFATPAGVTVGTTYARFRIGSTVSEVTTSIGGASSGEVEDYQVTIASPDLTISKTHTGDFLRGGTSTYTLRISNNGNFPTSGEMTVTDTLPANFTVNGGAAGTVTAGGANGANWACSSNATSPQVITCTSSTALPVAGSSVFTLNVNVAANAAASVTNTATVSGGGEDAANNGNNTATDPTTTVAPTDLTLSKSHTGNFTVGQTGTYSFTVNNTGGVVSSSAITVTDTLPTGLTFVVGSTTGTGWSCSASGQTVTCTSSAASTAAGSSTFSFNVSVGAGTVAGTNSITNTASVSGGGDSNTTNNSASDPTTILSPNLTIAKSHTPSTFVRGSTGTYTITVTNAAAATAATSGTLTVIDTLPAGLTFVAGSTTGTGWSCSASGQTVTCTNSTATLGAGASSAFSFSVSVATSTADSVTNTAVVSGGNEATSLNGNNTATDPTPTAGTPDLTLTKTHSGTFTRGTTGIYTLTVGNSGNFATSGTLTLTDTLPTGLSVNGGAAGSVAVGGANSANWSCSSNAASPQIVTCTSTTAIAVGGSSVFTLPVNVSLTAPASVVNSATVSGGGEAAVNNGNNSASDTTSTIGAADLSLTKSHAGSFTVGGTGTYSFTVTNGGESSSAGTITVTDTLPAGLTYAGGVSATGWSCSASGQNVTCTNATATLGVGASSAFSFSVNVTTATAPGSNSVTNTATVSGGGDSNTTNNSANSGNGDPTTILSSNLTITKTHTPTSFIRGSTGSYTITVGNTGTAPTSGTMTVTDTLPSGLTIAAGTVALSGANAANWSCTASGQTVTCTSSAAIPVNGSSTFSFTVNVSSSAASSVANVASVANPNEATANTGNNSVTDTTPTVGPPDLTIAKSHTGSFTVGGTGTYAFTVTNGGGSATTGTITVTDTLPAGLTYAGGVSGAGWSCSASGQTVTCTSSAVISSTVGSNTSTFSFNVSVGVGTALPSVTNTASIIGGGDVTSATGNGDVTTILSSNLTVSKTHTPATFVRGGTGTYTITVGNSGTAPTSGAITVTDTLPVGLSVNGGSAGSVASGGTNGANWGCTSNAASPQVVTCTSNTAIPTSGSSVFTFTVAVGATTALPSVTNNVAVANPNEATANTGNNTASDVTPTAIPTDLTLSKTASGTFIRGSTATYTLTVSNTGGTASSGTITVSDTLTSGLSYSGAVGSDWSCSASGQNVTCTTTASISAGASAPPITLTVALATGAPNPVSNTATVSGGGEIDGSNNSSTVTTPTLDAGLLTLVKTVRNITEGTGAGASNSGEPGDVLEYCVAYSNSGQSPVTSVLLTDAIPLDTTEETAVDTPAGDNYGGAAILWDITTPDAPAQYLTAAPDTDAGELGAAGLTVRVGGVPAGGAGRVCFRVSID